MPAIPNMPAEYAVQGVEDIFDAVISQLTGDDTANYYYDRILKGSKNLNSEIGAPTIVFVATGGTDFQSSSIGDPGDGTQLIGGYSATFEVHCWGESHTDAQALANGVLTALHTVTLEREQIEGETWIDTPLSGSGVVLVRHFKVTSLEIPAVTLPLSYPINVPGQQVVTLKQPDSPTDLLSIDSEVLDATITYKVTSP